MSYLPQGYEEFTSTGQFLNPAKFSSGEHRFRIMQQPIFGWLDWKDKKPYRFKPKQKPSQPFVEGKEISPFWACYVWDYTQKGLFILDIKQATIIKPLAALGENEDWGDFTEYDIKIIKVGEAGNSSSTYQVMPCKHKVITDEMEASLKENPVRLEAMYEGGNPWKATESIDKLIKGITHEEANYLEGLLEGMSDLKSSILRYLENNDLAPNIADMPKSLYDTMCTRALNVKIEREKQQLNTQKQDPIKGDLDSIFGTSSQEQEALPF